MPWPNKTYPNTVNSQSATTRAQECQQDLVRHRLVEGTMTASAIVPGRMCAHLDLKREPRERMIMTITRVEKRRGIRTGNEIAVVAEIENGKTKGNWHALSNHIQLLTFSKAQKG